MPNQPQAPAVELPGVRRLLLAETDPPRLSDEQTAAMTRRWEEAVAANPALFDGPTVVCAGLEWKDSQTLLLTWYRASYRLYLLWLDPVHAVSPPSVSRKRRFGLHAGFDESHGRGVDGAVRMQVSECAPRACGDGPATRSAEPASACAARACGDGPVAELARRVMELCSPRVRGWSACGLAYAARLHALPTPEAAIPACSRAPRARRDCPAYPPAPPPGRWPGPRGTAARPGGASRLRGGSRPAEQGAAPARG